MPWAALYGSMALSYQNPTDNAFGANQSTSPDLSVLKPTQARDYEIGLKLFSDHVPYLHHATLNPGSLRDETLLVLLLK